MTTIQIISLGILSGLASVDRLAGFNIMLSRPIVVAGIVGYIFGNVELCLYVGILFEFIGMLEVPVGTTIALDDTFGGYAASILLSIGATSNNAISILFCISIIVLVMYPVTYTDKYCRRYNSKLILRSIENNKKDYESKLISLGVIISFLRGLFIYNIATFIVWLIVLYLDKFHNTSFSSYSSVVLLSVFMIGYLVRFFYVKSMYKALFLVSGIFVGWFLL